MKTALAIFAKTPGRTPVKTRLGLEFGQEKAEAFYQLSVKAVEEVALAARDLSEQTIDIYWAMAERPIDGQPELKSFPVLWTGEGGLGKSLFNISASLLEKYEQIIIIGTDSPHIEETFILEAIERLTENPRECVIGPCTDGGFYLFGSTICIDESVWTGISYSRADTLEQLTDTFHNSGYEYSLLSELGDVDYLKDLKLLLEIFSAKGNKLPAQQILHDWMKAALG